METLALYYWHCHGGSLPVPLTPLSESAHTNHRACWENQLSFIFWIINEYQLAQAGLILMPSGDSIVPVELSSPCRMQHNADASVSMIINHVVVVFIYSLLFVVTAMELVSLFPELYTKTLKDTYIFYLCLVEWTAGYYTGCHQC